MRTHIVLATLFAVGIGGTGRAAPLARVPVHAVPSHVALYAYAVDEGGLATPLGTCEEIAAGDRASCRRLEAAITDARRTLAYADLSKGWDAERRGAFARLVAAQEAYAKAVGDNEIDHGAADAATAERTEKDAFLKTLRMVLRHQAGPADEIRDVVTLDAGLNAAYAHVMDAGGSENPGTVFEKAGIRRTERAWLAYRDAFVSFATTLDAPYAVDTVKAELTRRRTADLEALLAD